LRSSRSALAETIATRRGLPQPDERCSLVAAVCLVTYRRGLTQWLVGPAAPDPISVISHHFDMLDSVFAPSMTDAARGVMSSNGRRRAAARTS
jgi:hypothetical protein